MLSRGIQVRRCESLPEFENCLHLQRSVWNYSDVDLVPVPMLVMANKTGGHVLGAFHGDQMIGFTLGFAARHGATPYVHSHFLGVLPEYRDKGVGRALKLLQRERCLAEGVTLIEWTFDPLETKNAHFNLVRLGAIVRKYLPNLYGVTSSPLHGGIPTDRFVAEWHLLSPRVQGAIQGCPSHPVADAVKISFPARVSASSGEDSQMVREQMVRETQNKLQAACEPWFSRGYAAINIEVRNNTATYFLEARGCSF